MDSKGRTTLIGTHSLNERILRSAYSQDIPTASQIPGKEEELKTHTRSKSYGSAFVQTNRSRKVSYRDDVLDARYQFGQRPKVLSETDAIFPGNETDDPITNSGRSLRHGNGHKRQPSRSESIFTIRSQKFGWRDFMWWNRNKKGKYSRTRKIVPSHIVPVNKNPNSRYVGNEIRTAKYTILTFLPKNLFEQFKRFANIFFTAMILLNWILDVFGKELRAVPVLFVLTVTAIKDLFEDLQRHRGDHRVNNSTCQVYKANCNNYVNIKWRDLRVGDMVYLRRDEVIPADIVVFRTSDANGVCYIETSNLDGESNLKQREVVRGFKEKQLQFQPNKFRSEIEVGLPTTNMFSFEGSVEHPNGTRVPLTNNNLLLRGSTLANTDYVEGLVVYAGEETKAMLNNGAPRHKRSLMEKELNLKIFWCVLIMAVLCVIGITGSLIWNSTFPADVVPFTSTESSSYSPFDEIIITSLTFLLLLQGFIPYPLYVTIEFAKLIQIFHIENDLGLYDPEADERIACRSTNITEDLGQIKYIFSDKTGTLTENTMIFRCCAIGGINFKHSSQNQESPTSLSINPNPDLVEVLGRHRANDIYSPFDLAAQEFFIILALCNTVVVAKSFRESTTSGIIGSECDITPPVFTSESPDELALVHAAYIYRYELLERTPTHVRLKVLGAIVEYRVLHILPFDSVRKRMSIILQHPTSAQIILYSKGADSAIFPQLRHSRNTREEDIKLQTQTMIDNYAREGLRTLVMAKRSLTPSEYDEWLTMYTQAELDFEARDAALSAAYMELERNLELVGATGIEDRLQDGVPHAIEALHKAGIMIWVLTGDKRETAINIAYSCKLFSQTMEIINLTATSQREVDDLRNLFRLRAESFDKEDLLNSIESVRSFKTEKGLVVDGITLRFILNPNFKLLEPFLKVACRCDAVLCCRATPLQKAYIVRHVKSYTKVRTLAIGDGNNDVSMIQTADVGVGISSGKEGMQAVLASDFAISKFRFLERLLLVHGNWCYDRLRRMMLYFFYKNAVFTFLVFWCQMINGWSGSVSIDQLYQLAFSLLFTSLPPFIIGIYDQYASAETLMRQPELYQDARKRRSYQTESFWLNMLDAFYGSIIIFIVPYFAYLGQEVGNAEFGTTLFVSCLYVMLAHLCLELKHWTMIHLVSSGVSLGAFYIIATTYNSFPQAKFGDESPYMILQRVCATPTHWLIILLTIILSIFPRFVVRVFENTFETNSVPSPRKSSQLQITHC